MNYISRHNEKIFVLHLDEITSTKSRMLISYIMSNIPFTEREYFPKIGDFHISISFQHNIKTVLKHLEEELNEPLSTQLLMAK